jgi:hypothetical protein
MPRNRTDDDWEDDDFGDPDEEEDTIPCPYCRRMIHEDSVRCPYCEQYLSQEDASPGLKPWWLLIGAVVCLALVIMWIMNR